MAAIPESEPIASNADLPHLYRDLADLAQHAGALGANNTLEALERERALLEERWRALDGRLADASELPPV